MISAANGIGKQKAEFEGYKNFINCTVLNMIQKDIAAVYGAPGHLTGMLCLFNCA